MIRQKQEATWPFLCILACLFILSAASPRAWERLSGPRPMDKSAVAASQPVRSAEQPAERPRPQLAAPPQTVPASPSAAEITSAAQLADPAERVAGPDNLLALPEVAAVSPETPPTKPQAAAGAPGVAPAEDPANSVNLAPLAPVEPLVATIPDPRPAEAQPPLSEARSETPAPEALAAPSDPSTASEPEEPTPPQDGGWLEPAELVKELQALAEDPETGPWATETLEAVQQFRAAAGQRSDETQSILERLFELGRRSDDLEARLFDRPLGRKLRQARFALYRRVDLWRHAVGADESAPGVADASDADSGQISVAVAELDAMTAGSPEGHAWRRYLLIEPLKELAERRQSAEDSKRRQLARQILKRLSPRGLDPDQQRFINSGPVAALGRQLRAWAADPVDTAEVMRHVETYEATGLPGDAQAVAEDCHRLAYAVLPSRRALGQRLETHYRNANLRIVLTEDLLNRLMPERDPQYQWVNDTVLGSPVHGRSLTFTDVAIRTVPDPSRLRLALEVTGRVSSLTSATNGPATFYNRSESVYVARKPMEVGTFGIRLWPADVEVRNSMQLRGLETDFDPIPLVGSIVQEVARSQHEAKRCEANREIERKVATRAKSQVDNESGARLTSVSERLRDRVLGPMAALGLGPEMIEAKTADRRLTMRVRVGGDDQLGGNTPRPWAPSDSLASFQAHQSAVNNFIARLDLGGRTFTLPQLRAWVAARINRPEFAERTSDHDNVTVTFAERDPIVIRCEDGRFSVTLSIVRLQKDPNEWFNFQVRAFYRPEVDGQSARLVRDGVVQLMGDLDMRSQIGLRGLFGKAFDKDKPIDLTPERLSTDPRMADLSITQFAIEDGWVGIAVGPKRRGTPPEVARRPSKVMGPTF